jgi:hypothetical protein
MEDGESPWMHKYGGWKTTQIMMANVPHVTAWAGHMKYHADGFLFDWVYIHNSRLKEKWLRSVLLIVLYFPNLGKAREFNVHRWSAFMLLQQNVVEKI